jgi:hypothetical protein
MVNAEIPLNVKVARATPVGKHTSTRKLPEACAVRGLWSACSEGEKTSMLGAAITAVMSASANQNRRSTERE